MVFPSSEIQMNEKVYLRVSSLSKWCAGPVGC